MTSDELEATVEDSGEATAETSGSSRLPAAPYMPGKSFTNSFDRYASDGLPDMFDSSFFGNISGSTIAQTRSTMRYFDLIDDQYVPTEMMRDLVAADEATRKETFKIMVEEKYADALALSLNATSGQLVKIFNERGINGATVDKAIGFYLHMLDYVGIPYSSHFKKRRPSAGNGTRRRATKKQAETTPPPLVINRPKIVTEEEQKAAYIQTLLDLAKRDDADATLQDKIFDRIEKALGIGAGPTTPPPSAAPDGRSDSDSP
ncbi:DUF5343 domain-containing protein [Nocardioides halotolerans]|uniref:DUF5343 domain-containing protein n=1 Tax=Nocardioides halotolerans TaxID=433660 RepID=UPI000427C6EC|nr:DUF5343 domain-containing protein [Nocardioides halotolerans]